MLAAAEPVAFAQISSRSAESLRDGNIPSYLASSCAISDRSCSMGTSECVKALILYRFHSCLNRKVAVAGTEDRNALCSDCGL